MRRRVGQSVGGRRHLVVEGDVEEQLALPRARRERADQLAMDRLVDPRLDEGADVAREAVRHARILLGREAWRDEQEERGPTAPRAARHLEQGP